MRGNAIYIDILNFLTFTSMAYMYWVKCNFSMLIVSTVQIRNKKDGLQISSPSVVFLLYHPASLQAAQYILSNPEAQQIKWYTRWITGLSFSYFIITVLKFFLYKLSHHPICFVITTLLCSDCYQPGSITGYTI